MHEDFAREGVVRYDVAYMATAGTATYRLPTKMPPAAAATAVAERPPMWSANQGREAVPVTSD
jgi:hypothetical protein